MSRKQKKLRLGYIGRDGLGSFFGYVTDIATEEEVFDRGNWQDVETALGWARERADRVVIAYGDHDDSVFTAGVTDCEWPVGVSLPRWPPDDAVRDAIDAQTRRERENPSKRPGSLGVLESHIAGSEPENGPDQDRYE